MLGINIKTLVKIGLVLVGLALLYIYLEPTSEKDDFSKKLREHENLIDIADQSESTLEDLSIIEGLNNQNLKDIESYRKKIKSLEKEINEKIPNIRKLPSNSRDSLWASVGQFIISSRQDAVQQQSRDSIHN